MIILDENIPESQRQLLVDWRVRVKKIGRDIGRQGLKDREDVIPLLQSLRYPTLFTRDMWIFDRRLCHSDCVHERGSRKSGELCSKTAPPPEMEHQGETDGQGNPN
jgi:hypothetical protein